MAKAVDQRKQITKNIQVFFQVRMQSKQDILNVCEQISQHYGI